MYNFFILLACIGVCGKETLFFKKQEEGRLPDTQARGTTCESILVYTWGIWWSCCVMHYRTAAVMLTSRLLQWKDLKASSLVTTNLPTCFSHNNVYNYNNIGKKAVKPTAGSVAESCIASRTRKRIRKEDISGPTMITDSPTVSHDVISSYTRMLVQNFCLHVGERWQGKCSTRKVPVSISTLLITFIFCFVLFFLTFCHACSYLLLVMLLNLKLHWTLTFHMHEL